MFFDIFEAFAFFQDKHIFYGLQKQNEKKLSNIYHPLNQTNKHRCFLRSFCICISRCYQFSLHQVLLITNVNVNAYFRVNLTFENKFNNNKFIKTMQWF